MENSLKVQVAVAVTRHQAGITFSQYAIVGITQGPLWILTPAKVKFAVAWRAQEEVQSAALQIRTAVSTAVA
jgi:hypothetical protein